MKRERGTLRLLVTKYYIFFAAAVLALAFFFVRLTEYAIANVSLVPDLNKVIEEVSSLDNEKYDRINVKRYLGGDSYIEILDENAKVIYTSDSSKTGTYNLESLEYIPPATGEEYYYLDSVTKKSGEVTGYVLQRYVLVGDYDDNDAYYTLESVAFLDENKKVIYADEAIGADDGSKVEFDYIEGGYEDDTYLQKHEFVSPLGAKRYLIIHQDYSSEIFENRYRNIYMAGIGIFLLFFLMAVVFFVIRTSVAVRKPILMLQEAMENLGGGKRDIDITYSGPREFVRIVDAFNDMSENLHRSEVEKEELEKERQKIIADISHDLKTPITVIQGYARAVSDGLVPESEQQKYLETIAKKSDNLSDLINTFYEYSKLEHPEFKLNKKKEDVYEYFREYLAGKYEELELEGFFMEIDLPEKMVELDFDKTQLVRVFENIISNCVKSNPKGTTIYASLEEKEGKVIIRLGDNGVGIPDAIRGNVFKPFVVGEEARTSGKGTGLGLAIAKLIVEAHGGTIKLLDGTEDYKTMFEMVF